MFKLIINAYILRYNLIHHVQDQKYPGGIPPGGIPPYIGGCSSLPVTHAHAAKTIGLYGLENRPIFINHNIKLPYKIIAGTNP